jgi:hypothetical protein
VHIFLYDTEIKLFYFIKPAEQNLQNANALNGPAIGNLVFAIPAGFWFHRVRLPTARRGRR